jgi:hypothetical protein
MNKIRQIIEGFKNPATRSLFAVMGAIDIMLIALIIVTIIHHNWLMVGLAIVLYVIIYKVAELFIADFRTWNTYPSPEITEYNDCIEDEDNDDSDIY